MFENGNVRFPWGDLLIMEWNEDKTLAFEQHLSLRKRP